MFFDLIDVALLNSHIVYAKLGKDISLLNFKTVVTKALSSRYSNCKRFLPTSRSSKWKFHEPSIPKVPTHMPEIQEKQMRCHYCKNEGSDHKTFVSCQTCSLPLGLYLYLWLTKERNWSIIYSVPSRLQCLLYTFSKINCSCVDCLFFFTINTASSM